MSSAIRGAPAICTKYSLSSSIIREIWQTVASVSVKLRVGFSESVIVTLLQRVGISQGLHLRLAHSLLEHLLVVGDAEDPVLEVLIRLTHGAGGGEGQPLLEVGSIEPLDAAGVRAEGRVHHGVDEVVGDGGALGLFADLCRVDDLFG